MKNQFAIVVMAAGKGVRMNSELPKVLIPLEGKPLLGHVLELARQLNCPKVVAVVGYQREKVIEYAQNFGIEYAIQEEQLGTGHAVMQSEQALSDFEGDVLVLSGDVPLLTVSTVEKFYQVHRQNDASATVLSAVYDNPFNYGRIVRDESGSVREIVEEKDATEEQRAIQEINSGIYFFRKDDLFSALKRVTNTNASHEFYLTDTISVLLNDGKKVQAFIAEDPGEIAGINTPAQLEEAAEILRHRRQIN